MGQPMGGQNANRMEVRVRGNANQLLEKYKVLARDAHQAGDRVAAEYYLQHADHYFRVLNDSRIRQEEMRARRGVFDQYEDDAAGPDGDEHGADGNDEAVDGDRTGDRPRGEQQRPERRERQARDGDRQEHSDRQDERPRRWEPQERRPARDDPPRDTDRAPRPPRMAAESSEQRISDGEAALVAFGGVPQREAEPATAGEEETPRPRRRGRPRKAEAEPVEG
jgi:hypothetical protein